MNNVQLIQVGTHKHLGVNLNNKYSWSDHINDITCYRSTSVDL